MKGQIQPDWREVYYANDPMFIRTLPKERLEALKQYEKDNPTECCVCCIFFYQGFDTQGQATSGYCALDTDIVTEDVLSKNEECPLI